MPRKFNHDQRHHLYVKSNSYYGCFWVDNSGWKTGYQAVPYAPSWRTKNKKPSLILKGKKP